MEEATDRFWHHADSVGAFLKRDTAPFPGSRVGAQDMFSAYVGFCARNGLEPETRTAFGTRLGQEGFNEATGRRTKDSTGRRVYRGLSVSHPTP